MEFSALLRSQIQTTVGRNRPRSGILPTPIVRAPRLAGGPWEAVHAFTRLLGHPQREGDFKTNGVLPRPRWPHVGAATR